MKGSPGVFYERHGFVYIGEMDEDGELIMRRELYGYSIPSTAPKTHSVALCASVNPVALVMFIPS